MSAPAGLAGVLTEVGMRTFIFTVSPLFLRYQPCRLLRHVAWHETRLSRDLHHVEHSAAYEIWKEEQRKEWFGVVEGKKVLKYRKKAGL